ncbi:MAG TPA: CHAT domain-containing tetratricopeptide repeat protein [Sphingobium sp.]|nr:CHAT domain-containing tetratricopeptide repeat protein [Sphingobium sp.]
MRLPLLLAALTSAAAAAPIAPAPQVPLGAAITGESCDLRLRDDVAPATGMPADQLIYCDGVLAGSLSYTPLTVPQDPAAGDAKALIATAFDASRPWASLRQALDCETPAWLEDGTTPIRLIACHRTSGNWPSLVLAAPDGHALAIAEGPAALYPVLRRALKAPLATSPTARQVQQFWQQPVEIASTTQVAQLQTVLRQARTAASLGHFDDAEDLFRTALGLQAGEGRADDMAMADTVLDLALNVSNQGRDAEAAALFRRAELVIQTSAALGDQARLATYRGYEAANLGKVDAALRFAQTAVSAWRTLAQGPTLSPGGKSAAEAELAMALNLQGRMLLRQGDLVSAYASAGEALLILDRVAGEPRWWKSDVLMTMGDVSVAQGSLSAAETYFRNALLQRQQVFGEGTGTLRARAALGRAYQSEGMNEAAIVAYREAFAIARQIPRGSIPFSNQDLMPFAAAIVDHAGTLRDEGARQGLYAELFDAFQFIRSPVIERTISQTSARLSAGNPQAAAMIRDVQDKERALGLTRIRLAYEQSLPGQDRSGRVESRLANEVVAQAAGVQATRAGLQTRFPAFATLIDPQPLALDRLRQTLGPKEAVVSFLVGRDSSFVQVVRREGTVIGASPLGEEALHAAVDTLRRALEIEGSSVNDLDLAQAHALYRDLFGAVEPAMAGVDHLVIVPSGPLASLPFSLLVTSAPQGKDYRKADWLVKKASVTHAPSLASFVTLRAAQPAKRPERPLLAFGNPLLGSPVRQPLQAKALFQLSTGCRQDAPMAAATLRGLPSLPDTDAEMRAVARALNASPASIRTGEAANEAALNGEALDQYRVLYFATHGLLPGELRCQTEPALVLTPPAETASARAFDGLLEASEIAGLSLNADLVVLSACNTAAGDQLGGEAMAGLSQAFFHAGARNMLITHWQVPSAATTRLMTGVFDHLADGGGINAADALRAAQLALIDDPKTAHPFFWGAFVLMGDGGVATQLAGETL